MSGTKRRRPLWPAPTQSSPAELGVCIATSGPGGIHLLNGLYDAKMDHAPVLAITGLQHSDLIGTLTQQDVALDKLFIDVAVYNERIMSGAHMESVADLAIRTAVASRGVAHITIPVDVQVQEIKKGRSERNPIHHTSAVPAYFDQVPARVELEHSADILNRGKRIAILAGQGALHATQELEEMAEILGAPIIKALLGKAAVPDDSPYTTGGIGLLGTEPSQDAIEGCDTLLMVGTSFPYIEFLPEPGSIKCVQIDIDPQRISLRHPADVGLVGDAKNTLRALLPLLEKHDKSFLEKAQKAKAEWQKLMEERGTRCGQADEAASGGLGTRQAYPCRTRLSPPIPARSRPGGRATYLHCAVRSTVVRAIWRPWHAACPTRLRRRSRILTGRSSVSSATAA